MYFCFKIQERNKEGRSEELEIKIKYEMKILIEWFSRKFISKIISVIRIQNDPFYFELLVFKKFFSSGLDGLNDVKFFNFLIELYKN